MRFRTMVATSVVTLACVGSAVLGPVAALKPTVSSPGTVTWSGNGTTWDGTNRVLKSETCDGDNTPYLLWVLAASKASSATITIDGSPYTMTRANGGRNGVSTFKFTWTPNAAIALGTASGAPTVNGDPVTAALVGGARKATLTISHGCLGQASGGLEIVFVGQPERLNDGGPNSESKVFRNLSYSGVISFCDTQDLTNCVSFDDAETIEPGASRTLTLTTPGPQPLSYGAPDACFISLWTSAPTAETAWATTGATETLEPYSSGTTTSTWANGSTLYFTHGLQC